MIVSAYIDEYDNMVFTTEGCGCCSVDYILKNDSSEDMRIKVINHLKHNLTVLKEELELLNMNIEDLENY